MINSIVFGQYIQKESFLHQLNPVIKMICLSTLIFAVFSVDTAFALLMLLIFTSALAFFSKITFKNYIKTNKFILYISAFISVSSFLVNYYGNSTNLGGNNFWQNFDASAAVFLRLVLLAISNSVFLFTTSVGEIAVSLEQILYPLKFLGLNTRKFSFTVSMAIKFVPIISQEIQKIIVSQKSRGTNFNEKSIPKKIKKYSKITAPLIVNILKKADALACSMVARGYSLEGARTQFKKITVKKCDIIYLFLFLTIIFGVMVCNNTLTKNPNLICEILR